MEPRLFYAALLFHTNESNVQKKKPFKIQIFLNQVTGRQNNQNICIYNPPKTILPLQH